MLYVCYYNDIPIGNCELMLNNEVAKIEDFNILENYQSIIPHFFNRCKQYQDVLVLLP